MIPMGGRAQLRMFSQPTKFQYSQMARAVPMMPEIQVVNFMRTPEMLEMARPPVYRALLLVVQMLAPSTMRAGMARPWAIIT